MKKFYNLCEVQQGSDSNYEPQTTLLNRKLFRRPITKVLFHPKSYGIACLNAINYRLLSIYNLKGQSKILYNYRYIDYLKCICYSANGAKCYIGTQNNQIIQMSLDLKVKQFPEKHNNEINAIIFNDKYEELISGSDSTVIFWERSFNKHSEQTINLGQKEVIKHFEIDQVNSKLIIITNCKYFLLQKQSTLNEWTILKSIDQSLNGCCFLNETQLIISYILYSQDIKSIVSLGDIQNEEFLEYKNKMSEGDEFPLYYIKDLRLLVIQDHNLLKFWFQDADKITLDQTIAFNQSFHGSINNNGTFFAIYQQNSQTLSIFINRQIYCKRIKSI